MSVGGLRDAAAERAVLAGICRYGTDIYLDICDFVKTNTFTIDSNKIIYSCLDHICKDQDNISIDLPSILSASKELGLDHILERNDEMKHLASVLNLPVEKDNVRRFAGKIRRLEVARLMHNQADVLKDKMLGIQGTEDISEIIATAEGVIFDFTSLLDVSDDAPEKLGEGLDEYLQHLIDNPVQQMGISTGFPEYDRAIGGGLRPATLNVLAARPKVGKTTLGINMAYNIARQNIPVLNLDTEMVINDHRNKTLAKISGIDTEKIETGHFGQNPREREKVWEASEHIKQIPYYHKSIAGMRFEDQLALTRRWIQKEVGLKPDGSANECVIVYDYLKLMDANTINEAMREFQALGFMMTTLHNFAHRYKVPFIVTLQLNRDGINAEGTEAASGSDRIIWLCSNFTIFKRKSEEEIAEAGPEAGNMKKVVVEARHGPGTEWGDYINCHMNGDCARITEGQRNFDVLEDRDVFAVEEDNNGDDIPFE